MTSWKPMFRSRPFGLPSPIFSSFSYFCIIYIHKWLFEFDSSVLMRKKSFQLMFLWWKAPLFTRLAGLFSSAGWLENKSLLGYLGPSRLGLALVNRSPRLQTHVFHFGDWLWRDLSCYIYKPSCRLPFKKGVIALGEREALEKRWCKGVWGEARETWGVARTRVLISRSGSMDVIYP